MQPPRIPGFLAAAVADPARPAADVARDANRKPAETLAFAGVEPGVKVAELLPGGGYFTRIISKAVGSSGHVYALVPAPRPDAPADAPDFAARVKAIAADPDYSNVSVVVEPFAALKTPEPVDLVWTSQNYHDLHNFPGLDLEVFNQMVFEALKPGGIYLILDHASVPGAGAQRHLDFAQDRPGNGEARGARRPDSYSSARAILLHRPADPHTAKVFDPAIRGQTDQFILKFRKPAKP